MISSLGNHGTQRKGKGDVHTVGMDTTVGWGREAGLQEEEEKEMLHWGFGLLLERNPACV